jgi:hypothetical protein
MAAFPSEIVVRDHGSPVDALRAAKEHLQISNETLEALAGLCAGHVDKLFNGEKRVGCPWSSASCAKHSALNL